MKMLTLDINENDFKTLKEVAEFYECRVDDLCKRLLMEGMNKEQYIIRKARFDSPTTATGLN